MNVQVLFSRFVFFQYILFNNIGLLMVMQFIWDYGVDE